MKRDIILAGVGGQGILSIAACIGLAAVKKDMHLKQAETHGMSQRGGDVQSHLRISDEEIFSDLIPKGHADIILSVEPMESLRYLPFLSPQGYLITNTAPFNNITNYPEMSDILEQIESLPNKIAIDANSIAKEVGSTKVSNIVMLGAASSFLSLEIEELEGSLKQLFGKKGEELVEMNIKALHAGRDAADKLLK